MQNDRTPPGPDILQFSRTLWPEELPPHSQLLWIFNPVGSQVGPTWFTLLQSTLAVPSCSLLPPVSTKMSQGNSFHDLPRVWPETDWAAVSWIVLGPFSGEEHNVYFSPVVGVSPDPHNLSSIMRASLWGQQPPPLAPLGEAPLCRMFSQKNLTEKNHCWLFYFPFNLSLRGLGGLVGQDWGK